MNRQKHLNWCKERALEYIKMNDIKNAFASMCSDLKKHPETEMHSGIELGLMLTMGGHLNTSREMKDWITGFH